MQSEAKRILTDNIAVPYGIFGIIAATHYFPPRPLLNEFFTLGYDPCDQDKRMKGWTPFELAAAEYQVVKQWWVGRYPQAKEESFGVSSWNDWIEQVLENLKAKP